MADNFNAPPTYASPTAPPFNPTDFSSGGSNPSIVASTGVQTEGKGCPKAFKVLLGIVVAMIVAVILLLIYQCTTKNKNSVDSCNNIPDMLNNSLKNQQPMMARAQHSRMQHNNHQNQHQNNTRPAQYSSPPPRHYNAHHNGPNAPHNSPQQAHRYGTPPRHNSPNSRQHADRLNYRPHPQRFDEMVTGPYVYPPTQYQQPIYDAPAPMPQSQLMQPPSMAVEDVYLPGVPSSSTIIGEAQMDIMTTENQGTSIDSFSDTNYLMDPAMMTPGGASDIMGLQTFMPYMGGGVGDKDNQNNGEIGGPVDPNTGLPLFTTGKLIRSQLLGGHGASSFLRQVQDPLSGYRKSIGKNLCGVQQARRDVEVRRKQLNAARLEHPDADPILFNTSDFAYN